MCRDMLSLEQVTQRLPTTTKNILRLLMGPEVLTSAATTRGQPVRANTESLKAQSKQDHSCDNTCVEVS